MTSPEAPITGAEVCEALGIDRSTLTRWVHAGKVSPLRQLRGLRGAFLYHPSVIDVLRHPPHAA